MNITKIESGFAIKFPFALKDGFRAAFPSAKWDSVNKQWTVGSKSLARLEAWVEAMSAAAGVVEVSDELAFTEKEIASLKEQAALILKDAGAAADMAAQLKAAKELLKASQKEVDAAVAAKDAAVAEKASEKAAFVALLESVIDLDAVRKAMRVMAANHVPSVVVKKAAFEEARKIVKEQEEALEAAGFTCEAISRMARANVNRPDRDAVTLISESAWSNVEKV